MPRSGGTPKWDFGVAMLPVGALCIYQAHFGRTVLPKWPFWAHLFYSVFYSVSELWRACFRIITALQKLLPARGVIWALRVQSWKQSPRMSSRPGPKKSKTESRKSQNRNSKPTTEFQKGLEVCYCLWGCHPNNHKGGTVTGGYGFGYVSDMYPSPF